MLHEANGEVDKPRRCRRFRCRPSFSFNFKSTASCVRKYCRHVQIVGDGSTVELIKKHCKPGVLNISAQNTYLIISRGLLKHPMMSTYVRLNASRLTYSNKVAQLI